MFDYLQKFNSLPADLRAKVSSDDAMNYLSALEHRYQLDLAMVVMKVMIKSLAISDLESTLISEFGLRGDRAKNLSNELKEKIFAPVADYVGLKSSGASFNIENDIDSLIKEAGITITSSDLLERLKVVLSTYIKGVRQKIDTREVLAKEVASGGLGLSQAEIDRVFKVCERRAYISSVGHHEAEAKLASKNIEAAKEKAKLDASSIFKFSPAYDLKKALESGETKKISAPVVSPKISAPSIPPVAPKALDFPHEKVDIDDLESQLHIPAEDNLESQVDVSDKNSSEKQGEEKEVDGLVPSDSDKVDSKEETKEEAGASKDKEAFIVKKPEESNLFKKLFFENKNKKRVIKPDHLSQADGRKIQTKEIQGVVGGSVAGAVAKEASLLSSPTPKAQVQKDFGGVRRSERPSDRKHKRLDDVKLVPKVMGPLEELLYLDVLNFRRLGKTPIERTAKIFNKIKLLERNGYGKMIEAITAWKKSPVNRLYLQNVQLAMSKGETVSDFVNKNTEEGNNLSFEEIEAIINLNSRLIF